MPQVATPVGEARSDHEILADIADVMGRRDAFTEGLNVDGWLRRYHARAIEAGLPVPALETFLRDADWCGIQRHLKILGIFCRLHYRDGKSKYIADLPRFIAYLDEVLPRYAELQPLADLLERRIKPALLAKERRDA